MAKIVQLKRYGDGERIYPKTTTESIIIGIDEEKCEKENSED